ncbi:hypothetical protein E2C01_040870 [Portunus trituberculatus]|uniref:Uncharacterized protein n=1 Tax=Portunus trituberculatus TaxID=210409 RepID=A0A5B7FNR6_PORTR|nr:hypothetical protein [Portunus trituberculatus]
MQRKFLEEELRRLKELMQRGGNKGDKEVTGEEGEGHGAIKEKERRKGDKRWQAELMDRAKEEEKMRLKQEGNHYCREEESKVKQEQEQEEEEEEEERRRRKRE